MNAGGVVCTHGRLSDSSHHSSNGISKACPPMVIIKGSLRVLAYRGSLTSLTNFENGFSFSTPLSLELGSTCEQPFRRANQSAMEGDKRGKGTTNSSHFT